MLAAVEPHRLAEERSIAYHRAVAARLEREPAVLVQARARVRAWLVQDTPPHYARAWDEVLSWPVSRIVEFLVDPGERARELRQSTPFAGAVPPRERWRIWRDARAQAERTP